MAWWSRRHPELNKNIKLQVYKLYGMIKRHDSLASGSYAERKALASINARLRSLKNALR